jgi:anthranilate synthase component 1
VGFLFLAMRIEFAADLETPVSAFLKLAPFQPVFLLESVEKNETMGRFSFIGILPAEYFTLNDPTQLDPYFQILEAKIQSLPQKENGRLFSGMIGFLSYPLSSLLHPKIRFRRADEPLAGFVLPSAILCFDHLKNKIYLNSILPENEEQRLARELRSALRSMLQLTPSGKSSEPKCNMSYREFCAMVDRARELIAAGEIYQVVLSMQFDGETDAHPFQMYRALRMINPSPYMFYLNFHDTFQFFGSSPETMVRTEGSKIILRPIAGTRPRGQDDIGDQQYEAELLQDEKEKAEHLMLVDLARNDLGRLASPGSVKVTEFMKVERYSHVMHLVSTVESQISRKPSLRQLLASVFPAGTVSGAPKVRAMQIIDELEPHGRGLYAGSVGYFGPNGILDHCISIRCLQHQQGRYRFTAGAGIVADSSAANEFAEINNKGMALRKMLIMAESPL